MRHVLTTLLFTVFTLITHNAFADGLLYQLPKDGAYVLYDLKFEATTRGDQKITAEGTFKISSVGTVTEKGKKCRWIEFKMTMTMNGNDRVTIGKLLVPEENLKAGRNAFDNKMRGWVKLRADADVKELDDTNSGPMPAFVCGLLKDAKKLTPVIVESKLGKLKCAGVSGYTEYQERGRNSKATYKTRRHKKAPFGVVSSVLTFETERNGQFQEQGKMTFTLKEVGKNAKSELSDAK